MHTKRTKNMIAKVSANVTPCVLSWNAHCRLKRETWLSNRIIYVGVFPNLFTFKAKLKWHESFMMKAVEFWNGSQVTFHDLSLISLKKLLSSQDQSALSILVK